MGGKGEKGGRVEGRRERERERERQSANVNVAVSIDIHVLHNKSSTIMECTSK